MEHPIELIRIGPAVDEPVTWAHGSQQQIPASLAEVAAQLNIIVENRSAAPGAVLLLDSHFPLPPDDLLGRLLDGPADVWHGGLRLGLEGQPRMWEHVDPLSMFSAPLDPTIEATSWRVSLRALLVRTEVLEQLGGLDTSFDTLVGAGLDAGLRWIRGGALVRHVPDLVPLAAEPDLAPPAVDGLRLVGRHRGRVWAGWALQRAVLTREVRIRELPRLMEVARSTSTDPLPHYRPAHLADRQGSIDRSVSVVIPTVDRYPYLEPLLHQLAAQTIAPHEVFIIDQTPLEHRRRDLAEIEPDLPVQVIEIPVPGQSTARNAALQRATGELILLLDDDLDIEPTLIEAHLRRLIDGVDAVSGGVDDATAGPPPDGFRHRRASDVFPAGNTIVRRSALERSGLFDPAFDHGPRADHDLGMRLHLAGAVLMYEPTVEVFHHHAPVGGLRTHGARKVTRASSRRSVMERDVPAATQLYLHQRYYTASQRKEGRLITLVSMLSGDGSLLRQIGRAAVQTILLPSTARIVHRNGQTAKSMLLDRPPIPTLESAHPDLTTP